MGEGALEIVVADRTNQEGVYRDGGLRSSCATWRLGNTSLPQELHHVFLSRMLRWRSSGARWDLLRSSATAS